MRGNKLIRSQMRTIIISDANGLNLGCRDTCNTHTHTQPAAHLESFLNQCADAGDHKEVEPLSQEQTQKKYRVSEMMRKNFILHFREASERTFLDRNSIMIIVTS